MTATWELRTEVSDRRQLSVLGRTVEVPLSGKLTRVVSRDDRDLLSGPAIRHTDRKGDHVLGGHLGQGAVLERRRWSKLRLVDGAGQERCRIEGKMGRPTRRFRQSWDVTRPGGERLSLTEAQSVLDLSVWKRDFVGDVLSTYQDKDGGWRLAVWNDRAVLEVDERSTAGSLIDDLVAAVVLYAVFDLHQTPTT